MGLRESGSTSQATESAESNSEQVEGESASDSTPILRSDEHLQAQLMLISRPIHTCDLSRTVCSFHSEASAEQGLDPLTWEPKDVDASTTVDVGFIQQIVSGLLENSPWASLGSAALRSIVWRLILADETALERFSRRFGSGKADTTPPASQAEGLSGHDAINGALNGKSLRPGDIGLLTGQGIKSSIRLNNQVFGIGIVTGMMVREVVIQALGLKGADLAGDIGKILTRTSSGKWILNKGGKAVELTKDQITKIRRGIPNQPLPLTLLPFRLDQEGLRKGITKHALERRVQVITNKDMMTTIHSESIRCDQFRRVKDS